MWGGALITRLAALALLLAVSYGAGGPLQAEQGAAPSGDWEATGLAEPIARLFTPTSGALLAAGSDKLLRSDDAGLTWTPVRLPPGASVRFGLDTRYQPPVIGQGNLAVDPTNHAVLYVEGSGRLHKSADGGASWAPLPTDGEVVAVAVSPANPTYVHLVVQVAGTREWHRLRSRDGGATWEELSQFRDRAPPNRPPLDYQVYLLQSHPTDPERVFVAAGGTTGRSTRVSLYDIRDDAPAGSGGRQFFDPGHFIDAEHLAGGGGAAPRRFYAAFNLRVSPYNQATRTRVLRTDDDGATQTMLLEVQGGGSVAGRQAGEQLLPASFVDALAYDPAVPDRVYVGLNEYVATVQRSGPFSVVLTRSRSRVIASADGGATWTDLGREDLGAAIRDLALGIDGANLYATTEAGVYRLRLPAQ